MSLKSTILRALGISVAVAGSALSHAVVAVAQKGNPIGDATIKAVAAAEATNVDGPTKKATVLAAVLPVFTAELAKSDLNVIVTDVEQFAGMVIEEVVAQTKTTGLLAIALQVLTLLGIK